MNHVGIAMTLKPGAYELYKKCHDEIWPEMVALLKQYGLSMVIYRFKDQLFVHGTAQDEAAWSRIEQEPVKKRWNQHMAQCLQTDANGQVLYHPMALAFSFGVFKTE